jgi:hypothetical protein
MLVMDMCRVILMETSPPGLSKNGLLRTSPPLIGDHFEDHSISFLKKSEKFLF